jgi:phosphoglycerol transferase MdoB-like AlkP superfamily enzyme
LLGEKGYHSSFFIGHPNGAMGYTSFAQLAGFQHYFGMDEYDNDEDFDGIWGIWDDKFFDFYADKLNEFPEPFFSVMFSGTSHHPFIVPPSFEGKFKGGEQPILKCIEYTDYVLRQFFKKVSNEPWYHNTLFVFTADHCSSEIIFEESRTTRGLFSVPVFFFKPDNSLASMEDEIIQQADIMPSVLGYLHYDKPYVAFGRDLFREQTTPMAFNYRDAYNLFMDDYLLNFDGDQVIGLYNFKTDKMLAHNLKSEKNDITNQLELKIKAIVQQYNNRLINNNLTIK